MNNLKNRNSFPDLLGLEMGLITVKTECLLYFAYPVHIPDRWSGTTRI